MTKLICKGLLVGLILILTLPGFLLVSQQSQEAEAWATTQSFFKVSTTSISVSPGGWDEVDISSSVPSGATGVVIYAVNAANSKLAFGARKPGSADERIDDIWEYGQTYIYCGVDGSRHIELYRESTSITFYLNMYTGSGVIFFTDGIAKTGSAVTASGWYGWTEGWIELDCSANVPSGATGLIFETAGMPGSSMRYPCANQGIAGWAGTGQHGWWVSPCTTDKKIWANNVNPGMEYYLIGYTITGIYWNYDGSSSGTKARDPDVHPTTNDAWEVRVEVPSGCEGVLIGMYPGSAMRDIGMRSAGSGLAVRKTNGGGTFCIKTDPSGDIEIYMQDVSDPPPLVVGYLIGAGGTSLAQRPHSTSADNDVSIGYEGVSFQTGYFAESPSLVGSLTPMFSARFRAPAGSAITAYRLIIGSYPDIESEAMWWDSGVVSWDGDEGSYCTGIVSGVPLYPGVWYWAIKFYSGASEGIWSSPVHRALDCFQVDPGLSYRQMSTDAYNYSLSAQNTIAITSAGVIYVASLAIMDGGTYTPSLLKSTDNGATTTIIDLGLVNTMILGVVVDRDDHLWILYFGISGWPVAYSLYCREHDGTSWVGAATEVGANSLGLLAVDADGNIQVMYVQNIMTWDTILLRRIHTMSGWEAPETVLDGGGGDVAMSYPTSFVIHGTTPYLLINIMGASEWNQVVCPDGWHIVSKQGSTWCFDYLDYGFDTDVHHALGTMIYGSDNTLKVMWGADDGMGNYVPYIQDVYVNRLTGYSSGLYAVDSSYATVHGAATGTVDPDRMVIGQRLYGGEYSIYRGGLVFDTSHLPTSGAITSATITRVWCKTKSGDGTVCVVEGDSVGIPVVASNYGGLVTADTPYSVVEIAAEMLTGDYNDFPLHGSLDTIITRGSYTKFGVRLGDDINGIMPTGDDYADFNCGNGYRPVLEVVIGGVTYECICHTTPVELDSTIHGADDLWVAMTKDTLGDVYYIFNDDDDQTVECMQYVLGTGTWAARETIMHNYIGGDLGIVSVYYCEYPIASGKSVGICTQGFWAIRNGSVWLARAYFGAAATSPWATTISPVVAANTGRGFLNWDGGETCQYAFDYGITTGGTPPSTFVSTGWTGAISSSALFTSYIEFSPYVTYGLRAKARNSHATGLGSWLYFTAGVLIPTIYTNAATDISITSARLNSYLANDGGEATYVRFEYEGAVQYCSVGADDVIAAYGNGISAHWAAQVFATTASYDIVGVALWLYKEGSPGDLRIAIRAISGGHPTAGPDLSTGTLAASGVTLNSDGTWYYIPVASYTLDASTEYAIVLYTDSGDASNCVNWKVDTSSPSYGDGNLETSTNGGSSWSSVTGSDAMFGTFSVFTDTPWLGGYTTGSYQNTVVNGLVRARIHRFQAQAYNSANPGAPSDGGILLFVTAETLEAPTDLYGEAISGTQISLAWVRGLGSQNTKIVYKIGSYPTTYSDGTEGYFDTGSSTIVAGLVSGTVYYFRAWGYAPEGEWSAGYEDIVLNTPAGTMTVNPFSITNTPSGWTAAADASTMSNSFFYGPISTAAASLGMKTGVLFMMLFIGLSGGIGVFTYLASRSILLTLLAVSACFGGMVTIGIMPLWILFTYIIIAGGSWYLATRAA